MMCSSTTFTLCPHDSIVLCTCCNPLSQLSQYRRIPDRKSEGWIKEGTAPLLQISTWQHEEHKKKKILGPPSQTVSTWDPLLKNLRPAMVNLPALVSSSEDPQSRREHNSPCMLRIKSLADSPTRTDLRRHRSCNNNHRIHRLVAAVRSKCTTLRRVVRLTPIPPACTHSVTASSSHSMQACLHRTSSRGCLLLDSTLTTKVDRTASILLNKETQWDRRLSRSDALIGIAAALQVRREMPVLPKRHFLKRQVA